MAGLALVRADGRRAGRWQAAWRSALVWAQWAVPFTAFSVLRWWQAGRPAGKSPLDFQQEPDTQTCLALFFLWTVLTVLVLPRTPHDRLAGTYVVPE
jgi:hypothetical protein